MSKFNFDAELASASAENKTIGPMSVVLDEADSAAAFVETYWKPGVGPNGHPGMVSVKSRIAVTMPAELQELVLRARKARREVLFTSTSDPEAEEQVARAELILEETKSTLEWLFDDGVDDAKDDALATLKAEHDGAGETVLALATELEDYLALAKPVRDEMDGAGGFDASMLDEGTKVVAKLRSFKLKPAGDARTAAIALRNRYLNLIQARVRTIRGSARHVFRRHPEIARLATSVYGRKSRAEARRAKKRAEAAAVQPQPAQPE